jgi:hypothetical protein
MLSRGFWHMRSVCLPAAHFHDAVSLPSAHIITYTRWTLTFVVFVQATWRVPQWNVSKQLRVGDPCIALSASLAFLETFYPLVGAEYTERDEIFSWSQSNKPRSYPE